MATRAPRVQLNLKVPARLREQVGEAARAEGVSINRFCEFGLSVYLAFLRESNPTPGGDRNPTT